MEKEDTTNILLYMYLLASIINNKNYENHKNNSQKEIE